MVMNPVDGEDEGEGDPEYTQEYVGRGEAETGERAQAAAHAVVGAQVEGGGRRGSAGCGTG